MFSLTERLQKAYRSPAATADFDLSAALEEVLGGVGLSASDAGGAVSHVGADPVLKSPLRIGGAATIALLAKSVAAAAHERRRGDVLAGPGGRRDRSIHVGALPVTMVR